MSGPGRWSWPKRVRFAIEAAGLLVVWCAVRMLPIDWASALGGFVARTIGPLLPAHRVGRGNLALALPEKSETERHAILRGAWDNLGRCLLEYPRLAEIWDAREEGPGARIVYEGEAHFRELREKGGAALFFSAHLANWELPAVCGQRHGLAAHVLFRRPNNPVSAKLLDLYRSRAMGKMLPIAIDTALQADKVIARGERLGMLIDQHAYLGVSCSFFGHPIQVPTLIGKLARRYRCPVYGTRIERLQGARFRAVMIPPLYAPVTDDPAADAAALTQTITAVVEGWVRDTPDQWNWLHRRWRSPTGQAR